MEWEEDPHGHANDFDNQRTPFSPPPLTPVGGSWDNIAADSLEERIRAASIICCPLTAKPASPRMTRFARI